MSQDKASPKSDCNVTNTLYSLLLGKKKTMQSQRSTAGGQEGTDLCGWHSVTVRVLKATSQEDCASAESPVINKTHLVLHIFSSRYNSLSDR